MPIEDFTPVTMMILNAGNQVRAFIHPVRMTILELLAREKQSVSGIARVLGVHPANLTHHFKLLEKAGLIKLVEKRDTGKNLEKFYRAAAYHFTANLVEDARENRKVLELSILHDDLTAALQALRNRVDEPSVFALLKNLRLNPEEVGKLEQSLTKLLDEFAARRPKDGAPFTVNISFYPGESHPEPEADHMLRADE